MQGTPLTVAEADAAVYHLLHRARLQTRRQAQTSISGQDQTMLCVRACHRTTALTFSKLGIRNWVGPQGYLGAKSNLTLQPVWHIIEILSGSQ
jgi:hypothetical protein